MVVPLHDDGVGGKEGRLETKLQLRPWRTGTKSPDRAWHEFPIASRNDEGLWTQNCAGLITIQYVPTVSTQSQAFTDETRAKLEEQKKSYARLKADNPLQVPISDFYRFINKLGVQLDGPIQRRLRI